jgi:hypothetical protein
LLNRLIERIGFGDAAGTLGFMALCLLLIAKRLLKKHLPPKHAVKKLDPQEL